MTNEEKLSKALEDFKTKHPSITSADLQTFILGWQEAVKNCFIPDVSQQRELLITAFTEADRTGYIELLTNAETIADKVISGNL